jgi:hypothetical protein
MFTRLMATSERSCTPAGRLMVRLGSAPSGTAQAPGPSDRAAAGGRPTTRTKLFFCTASWGAIWIGSLTRVPGSACS